jgi:predicted small lipoprotein YifL
MKRLLTTITILALAALTACDPLDPPLLDPPADVVNVPEGDTGCDYNVTVDGCDTPAPAPEPVDTIPPVEGCDPALGGTPNPMTGLCDYLG